MSQGTKSCSNHSNVLSQSTQIKWVTKEFPFWSEIYHQLPFISPQIFSEVVGILCRGFQQSIQKYEIVSRPLIREILEFPYAYRLCTNYNSNADDDNNLSQHSPTHNFQKTKGFIQRNFVIPTKCVLRIYFYLLPQ